MKSHCKYVRFIYCQLLSELNTKVSVLTKRPTARESAIVSWAIGTKTKLITVWEGNIWFFLTINVSLFQGFVVPLDELGMNQWWLSQRLLQKGGHGSTVPGDSATEAWKENIQKFYNIDLIYYKQHPHKHMLNSSGLSLPKNSKYVCRTIINWQVLWHILIKLCTINKT